MPASIGVSESALLARLNRALAKEGEKLYRAKEGSRAYGDMGRYYVVDLQTNSIAAKDCDLEALARERQVLATWETLAAE